jgi:glycosyltransferase involved in cell wall biosynthesis
MSRSIKRLKVGWICPCIGVGGADALMLGLCRYAHDLEFTGIAVRNQHIYQNYDWALKMMGGPLVPIHQEDYNQGCVEGMHYHGDFASAVRAACFDADIIITWCVKDVAQYLWSFERPLVELAQNTDTYARETCNTNFDTVDFTVACSHAARQVFNHPNSVNAVIYNAVDPGRVTPKFGGPTIRKLWGYTEDDKIILYMGRLVEEKNPEILLGALQHLPDEWKLLVVGSGYLEENFSKSCSNLAAGRVAFLKPQFHVGDLLAMADVFCLPTDFEGHPLAVCEAWLAGCPVVTTAIPVMDELTKQFGQLATIVPQRPEPKVLADALVQAVEPTDENLAMQHRAQMVTWSEFTLPAASAKWEAFLSQCVDKWYKAQRIGKILPIKQAVPKLNSFAKLKTVEGM